MNEKCYVCGKEHYSLCSVCDRPVCDNHIYVKRGSLYAICHNCQLKLREQFIKLPEALKDALCSDELTDVVYEICGKKGINDNIIEGIIISYIGMVFSGIKSTQQFQKVVEKETNLKSDEAKALMHKILYLFLVNKELQDWWMKKVYDT